MKKIVLMTILIALVVTSISISATNKDNYKKGCSLENKQREECTKNNTRKIKNGTEKGFSNNKNKSNNGKVERKK